VNFIRTVYGLSLVAVIFPQLATASEVSIGLYFGKAFAMPGDLSVSRKNGSREIYKNVNWHDHSFKLPLYYSVRLMYWPDSGGENGVALDFTHAKLYSNLQERVTVNYVDADGLREDQQLLGDKFTRLAFSHGYNLLTVNILYRSSVEEQDSFTDVSAYFGAGLGIAMPHVEIIFEDNVVDQYQHVGLVYQGIAGISFGPQSGFPLGLDYKVSYGDAAIDLSNQTKIEFSPLLHHFSMGPVFH